MIQGLKNILSESFKNLKVSIEGNNYIFGKYWQKDKKTFDVNFKDGFFRSRSSIDYLPVIINFKIWELLFWINFFLKKIILYPFIEIKSKIFQLIKKNEK